ncbi:MAG: GNAT family N-acetyltransferase [Actinomycetota bacterium]
MSTALRWMTVADIESVEAARDVFDYEVRTEWAQRFLEDPNHHLCFAYKDEELAGMITGVEITHPDKGTEMFLYELGVAARFRSSGIGKALVAALADVALERGCYGMWVLTDANNEAALRTYQAGGATDSEESVMLTWLLDPTHRTFGPEREST